MFYFITLLCYFVYVDRHIFLVGQQFFAVGCEKTAQIQLNDNGIEENHAAIFIRDNRLYVENLSFESGTFVNGVRVGDFEKIEVLANDKLKFGSIEFIIKFIEIKVALDKVDVTETGHLKEQIHIINGELTNINECSFLATNSSEVNSYCRILVYCIILIYV